MKPHHVCILLALILLVSLVDNSIESVLDQLPTCSGKNVYEGACSFRGNCTIDGKCICDANFAGSDCSICKEGLSGPDCDIPFCFGDTAYEKDVCGGRGKCVYNGTSFCECFEGYSGVVCHDFKCNGIDRRSDQACSGRGQCTSSNKCSCNGNYDPSTFCQSCLPSYSGASCDTKICSPQTTCNGKGVCDGNLNCVCQGNFNGPYCRECKVGFFGPNCDISCNANETCHGRGRCGSDGKCICPSSTIGENCDSCVHGWFGPKCDFSIDFDSFEMSKYGDSIQAKVASSVKRVFDCSEMIILEKGSILLGYGPQCLIDGERGVFKIILGSSSSISPGIGLSIRVYFNSNDNKFAMVKGKLYQPIPPLAVISTRSHLVSKSCGKMEFDGLSSFTFSKLRLTYSWRVLEAPTDTDLRNINREMRLYEASSITIVASQYSIGKYTVRLTVLDSITMIGSYDDITVEIVDNIIPRVSISNGDVSSMLLGSFYYIVPEISFGECIPKSIKINDYIYEYVFNPVGSAVRNLRVKQESQLLVFDPYSSTIIEQTGDYNFILNVTLPDGAFVEKLFQVKVSLVPIGIEFTIDEMTQSSDQDVYFKLIKKGTGIVKLSCMNMDTGSICEGFTEGASNINQVMLEFKKRMAAGMYKFKATIDNGISWVSSYATVTVVDANPEKVIRVSIIGTENNNLKLINPSQDLTLQSLCYDGLSSERIFQWSSPDLDLSSIVIFDTYIIIPHSLLVPGVAYSISLSISDGERFGESSISLIINDPPFIGTISESKNGYPAEALVQEYAISASNFFDTSLPLKYTFYIRNVGTNEWYLLKGESYNSVSQSVLPYGSYEIKVKVSDSYGATSETSLSLQTRLNQHSFDNIPIVGNETVNLASLFAMVSTLKHVSTSSQNETLKLTIESMLNKYLDELRQEATVSLRRDDIPLAYVIYLIAMNVDRVNINTAKLAISELRRIFFGNKYGFSKDVLEVATQSKNIFERKFSTSTDISLREDLRNIRVDYLNFALINAPADSKPLVYSNNEYTMYKRKLSTSSLGSLSESIGEINFSLIPNFGFLSLLTYETNVKLDISIQPTVASRIIPLSKQISFTVYDSNNNMKLDLKSSSVIASFSIPRVPNDNVLGAGCYIITMGDSATLTSDCIVETISDNFMKIQVTKVGTFVVGRRIPEPSPSIPNPIISVIPNPILSEKLKSNDIIVDNSSKLAYLSFLLFIPVIVLFILLGMLVVYFKVIKRTEKNEDFLLSNPVETSFNYSLSLHK